MDLADQSKQVKAVIFSVKKIGLFQLRKSMFSRSNVFETESSQL